MGHQRAGVGDIPVISGSKRQSRKLGDVQRESRPVGGACDRGGLGTHLLLFISPPRGESSGSSWLRASTSCLGGIIVRELFLGTQEFCVCGAGGSLFSPSLGNEVVRQKDLKGTV